MTEAESGANRVGTLYLSMDRDLRRASPRRGTLFCLPRGALTLIAGRPLQRSEDPTTQIGIVTLDANLVYTTAPRRVAAHPGVWPSARL